MNESSSDAVATLGARVRQLRRDRGLSLKALGREAGLSHPFLSQVERGVARPSMRSVERIARALDVPVGTLWTAPHPAARVMRADEGTVLAHARGTVRELTGAALRVRELSGGPRAWADEAETSGGEVVVYVVRGAVDVDLDGTVHALREGDTLFFDGAVRHRLRRRGGTRTRALYVTAA